MAAYRLPGGTAAVVGSAGPLSVVGLSALLLGRRPAARTLASGLVAAFGAGPVVLKRAGALDAAGCSRPSPAPPPWPPEPC